MRNINTIIKTFLKLLCRKKGTPRQLKRSYCRTIVRSLASRNSNDQCLKAFFENYPDVLKSVYSIGNYDPELGSLFDSMYYNSCAIFRSLDGLGCRGHPHLSFFQITDERAYAGTPIFRPPNTILSTNEITFDWSSVL